MPYSLTSHYHTTTTITLRTQSSLCLTLSLYIYTIVNYLHIRLNRLPLQLSRKGSPTPVIYKNTGWSLCMDVRNMTKLSNSLSMCGFLSVLYSYPTLTLLPYSYTITLSLKLVYPFPKLVIVPGLMIYIIYTWSTTSTLISFPSMITFTIK